MGYLATITSKRQFTIPSEVFKKAGFKTGEKVIVEEDNGTLKISKPENLVERLAGSVKIPKHFRGIDVDKAIKTAIQSRYIKGL